jgi:hypothetical protein
MTTATNGYTVFGRGVHLDVVYMVYHPSMLAAYRASAFIALTNLILKFFVECKRIRLKGFSTQPARSLFTNSALCVAPAGTINCRVGTRCWRKLFSAIAAITGFYGFPNIGRTFLGTILPFFVGLAKIKIISAVSARFSYFSSLPSWMTRADKSRGTPYSRTNKRTTRRRLHPTSPNPKHFTANKAGLFGLSFPSLSIPDTKASQGATLGSFLSVIFYTEWFFANGANLINHVTP